MQYLVAFVLLITSLTVTAVEAPASAASSGADWCPPDGPRLPNILDDGHDNMLRPGWVTLQMRVHPGQTPVTDIRVFSEAGGPAHAKVQIPLVRQWIGCASNQRDAVFRLRMNFGGLVGATRLPEKEGFGLYAFTPPPVDPIPPGGGYGGGVCPIIATLKLRMPASGNEIVQVESQDGAWLRDWLQQLAPDLDYMVPNPDGNRVEFPCKVQDGRLIFFER